MNGIKNVGKIFAFAAIALCTACETVKPYQRAYLNDHEMRLGKKNIERFNDNVHSYREGSSGGGSHKAGGGCGCN